MDVKVKVRINGKLIALQRAGKWFLGECPFNAGHGASLVVTMHGSWSCILCDVHGVTTFVLT